MSTSEPVVIRVTEETIPTYLPAPPDKLPMFLEKRVYQGSNGKVYPLPFTDRVAETKTDRRWQAIWLENRYLQVMILPEIGGRIHVARDRTNDYDFIYRQTVLKPALVGLAGPWISGGIEFNWPQHHRPATFLPVEYQIEDHADGSRTVWLGDHDPMARMKGMHGVCLHPDEAVIELKVRVYNRTLLSQTFLWWANVATRVHESYQSFFPPDVTYVADHARRAMSEYPLCQGRYYGVDYGRRGREGVPPDECPTDFVPPACGGPGDLKYAANDLSWYANIPVPTSYMCMGSKENFFGGYDHARQAGIVHVANHHIAPGKKQWTWGNHDFGYAWDRNLTDGDGPYIELMAGVYTDNQPDFSFLQPGETKTWSQFWYPIQKVGPTCHANRTAAVSLRVEAATIRAGVAVSRPLPGAKVLLAAADHLLATCQVDLAPDTPLVETIALPPRAEATDLRLQVIDATGKEIIAYQPRAVVRGEVPPPAAEPSLPEDLASADELYLTGLHLQQYRHATRCPTLYWREALRRDPLDCRCNNALGLWHLRRGEFDPAQTHFRQAIQRLVLRNPNPYDGEPFYNLGLCIRYQLDLLPVTSPEAHCLVADAYAAFYKATWNQPWAAASYHALAELDCRRGDWPTALEHLNRSLTFGSDNLRARDLKVEVLRRMGHDADARTLLAETLALDPLDWWARHLAGQPLACDLQTRLDLAHDLARTGCYEQAIGVLADIPPDSSTLPTQSWGAYPLVEYTLGWLHHRMGDEAGASRHYRRAAEQSPDYCFPARLEEIAILQAASRGRPDDARAPYYLGNLYYDRRRHEEAIALWQRSVQLDPSYSVAWRNLGIGLFNIRRQPAKARKAFEHAVQVDPTSARLRFERDQLWKRMGVSPARRLRELQQRLDLVGQRDDLSVELAALYHQTGQHTLALEVLAGRNFQPWEGGEGQALGLYVRSRLALGREQLDSGNAAEALAHFQAASSPPRNLGEAKHLLANQSDLRYWLGCALAALGDNHQARRHWMAAATTTGDFQEMSVRAFSEMTYYSALAWQCLGHRMKARRLLKDLLAHALKLEKQPTSIDYFATSLPTMLLFNDDVQSRQKTTALFLQGLARLGLGQKAKARALLRSVLERDPNHAQAADLM